MKKPLYITIKILYWTTVFCMPYILREYIYKLMFPHSSQNNDISLLINIVAVFFVISAIVFIIMWGIDKLIKGYSTILPTVMAVGIVLPIVSGKTMRDADIDMFFFLFLLPLIATSFCYSWGFLINRRWLSKLGRQRTNSAETSPL